MSNKLDNVQSNTNDYCGNPDNNAALIQTSKLAWDNFEANGLQKDIQEKYNHGHIIALTGGICSGKSSVAKILKKEWPNAMFVDADSVAKSLFESVDIKNAIKRQFGETVFDKDGKIINSKLREVAFDSVDHVQQLNQIMWEPTKQKIVETIQDIKKEKGEFWTVVLECALLYESGFDSIVDEVYNVHCPIDIRRKRFLQRDNTSNFFDIIVQCQLSEQDRMAKANYNIDNAGTIEDLQVQTKTTFESAIFQSVEELLKIKEFQLAEELKRLEVEAEKKQK